jgi:REP element-mobilizing transposase RayT
MGNKKSIASPKNLMDARKPGGTGVPPVQTFKATRRNLPHLQEPGRVYFLTWRCRDGVALSSSERTLVLSSLLHWDGVKWKVYTGVVLPDHAHVLAQPLPHPQGGTFALTEILHSIKSFTAHEINQQRGIHGPIWQDESFDRIVRDKGEFLEKWNYIRNNPVKAGLTDFPEDYAWLYERGP